MQIKADRHAGGTARGDVEPLLRRHGAGHHAGEILQQIPDCPVSLEVFADDFVEMERQANEIASWGKNVLVKIPATKEGIPAIRAALADGLSINITLMFSMRDYEGVVEAFLSGLEERLAAGGRVAGIASVASFFVSRVDTKVDALIDARLADGGGGKERVRQRRGIHDEQLGRWHFGLGQRQSERGEALK